MKVLVADNKYLNIGDGFYVHSLLNDLKEVWGGRGWAVQQSDGIQLYHHDFRLESRDRPRYEISAYDDVDLFVLSGPILRKVLETHHGKLIEQITKRGGRYAIMSAGGIDYDAAEIAVCRRFMEKYPPYILSTRDAETYDLYHDLADHAYNGVCSAFYIAKHYDAPTLAGERIVWAFDRSTEPTLRMQGNDAMDWELTDVDRMTRLSGLHQRVRDSLRSYPAELGGKELVRLWHHPASVTNLALYRRPNVYVAPSIFGYLTLLKNSICTISERIHACVPALAYGNPARLVLKDARNRLFDRLGLGAVTSRFVRADLSAIDREHEAFRGFLASVPAVANRQPRSATGPTAG